MYGMILLETLSMDRSSNLYANALRGPVAACFYLLALKNEELADEKHSASPLRLVLKSKVNYAFFTRY